MIYLHKEVIFILIEEAKKLISIVIPCYNEQETVNIFYKEITKIIENIDYEFEFIFVNDGSKDQTILKIQKLCNQDDRVKLLDFSRNFGKESAMLAGLNYAKGDAVILMDVDLQDPPELIYEMVKYWEQGYENIYTKRKSRKGEPILRSYFSQKFYQLINQISEIEIVDGARDYRLFSRPVVNELIRLQESNRFSKGLFSWIGYSSICLEFDYQSRSAGTTKWSFFQLCNYAIEGITSFSNTPLRLATYTGLFIAISSFIYLIYIINHTLIFGNQVPGWSSTVCIILFLGGIQILFLGIIGEYIGRIYIEVKKRPNYIVKSHFNFNQNVEENK